MVLLDATSCPATIPWSFPFCEDLILDLVVGHLFDGNGFAFGVVVSHSSIPDAALTDSPEP